MAGIASKLRDWLRTMLNIRQRRELPRRGPKPSIGARICCDDLRMTVQAGMSNELWIWLQARGWREITYKPDRRRYREISTEWARQLIDCPPEQREAVLAQAIEHATARHAADKHVTSTVTGKAGSPRGRQG
ncbi:MAG: hypothetical protein RMK97_00610 [Sutterellaceae bacterium]|nr:hypothetical protein [Burkholderiaceae bacterium]MCX7901304.1 hypothetical protein [Burkholderiaceae bacterium]MDW8429002.1 hypothetical protein [Sutterellaceae bacterium]